MKKTIIYLLALCFMSNILIAQSPTNTENGVDVATEEIPIVVNEDDRLKQFEDSLQIVERKRIWEEWYKKNKDQIPTTNNLSAANCSDDQAALVALYNALGGECWNNTWDLTQPMDTWYGVTVDESGCVTRLNLNYNNLKGTLPDELGNLDGLFELSLSDNQITGNLPSTMANLTNLQSLYLSYNQLSGTLPTWLGALGNLFSLELNGNKFSGAIPTELGNLTSLRYLYLSYNQFESIPSSISNLTELVFLDLSGNVFSGTLPSLASLTNLEGLWFYYSNFTGSISWIGSLTKLRYLGIPGNNFTGGIPTGISNLTNLESLDISSSNLTSLPSGLSALTKLRSLYLNSNPLGTIPSQISNLDSLERLSLYNCELTGTIPTWLEDFTILEDLNLGYNQLTGSVPIELGNLTKMRYLYLYNNELDGCADFTGKFPNLDYFGLQNNKLTFEDLLYNSEFLDNQYSYIPQANFGDTTEVTVNQGGSHTLSYTIDPGITTNVYNWYRNNTLLTTTTSPSLTISNIDISKAGFYQCKVTNPGLSGTLESSPTIININSLAVPTNDACGNAITLSVGTSGCTDPVTGHNTGATDSNNDTPAAPTVTYSHLGQNDVWYKFTVPASGIFRLNLNKGISERYSFWFAMYTGDCGNLEQEYRASGTYWHGNYSRNFSVAPAGTTIYLRLWFGDAENQMPGLFDLCISEESCISPSYGWSTPFTCSNANSCEDGYYARIQIYDMGNATSINITNDAGVAATNNITSPGIYDVGPLIANYQTIVTLEHNINSDCNAMIYLYGPDTYHAASNDDPCAATNLNDYLNATYSYEEGYYSATTSICEPNVPQGNCFEEGAWAYTPYKSSVWFSFDAPTSGKNLEMTLTTDSRVALWTVATCGDILDGTPELVYALDPCGYNPYTHILPCLNPGQTYYLQVVDNYYGNFTIAMAEGMNECSTDPTCELSPSVVLSSITKENYHVTNTIESDATISDAHGDVVFTAEQSITLKPNFTVLAGGSFHAYIAACPVSAIVPEEVEVQQRILPKPEELQLEVFPNPFQHDATIRFYTPEGGSAHIMVFDLTGQLVGEQKTNNAEGWNTARLNATQLGGGMYYVILQTEGKRLTEKVMVLR